VDVAVDGQPFTAIYPETGKKPVLFPIKKRRDAGAGIPFQEPRGARDHHHIGLWFHFRDVNGTDFWNNPTLSSRRMAEFGTIAHKAMRRAQC
jgi:hypothetical protein